MDLQRELIYEDRKRIEEFSVDDMSSINYLLYEDWLPNLTDLQPIESGYLQRTLKAFNDAYYICTLILMHKTNEDFLSYAYKRCSIPSIVFPMAYFFQKKVTARNTRTAPMTEENFTPMDVKRKIREIIADENPKKPYSDRILSEKLGEAGITISRHGREVSGGREYTGCKRQKKILKKRARGRIRLQVCTDSYSFRNGSIPVRTTPPIISTR